jgi:hypothetical protein
MINCHLRTEAFFLNTVEPQRVKVQAPLILFKKYRSTYLSYPGKIQVKYIMKFLTKPLSFSQENDLFQFKKKRFNCIKGKNPT